MMTIDSPSSAQIGALRSLWKEAFGDTDLFLDAFFTVGFSPRRCRCITEDGTVLAALYWFEVTCQNQRFAYLYGVATAASHRGRGLFSALLRDTKQVLETQGFDGILLVPENENLGKMYEKFGFGACTAVREFTVDAGEVAIPLREIGAEEFAQRRRGLLPPHSVLQEGDDLQFLASQCHFWAGEDFLAVGQVYNNKLVCMEHLGNEDPIPGFLRALNVPSGRFRTVGGETPFAYLLPLREGCVRPDYFGLALD